MYFAWLGFYTSAMVYPAVFGSILYTFTDSDQVRPSGVTGTGFGVTGMGFGVTGTGFGVIGMFPAFLKGFRPSLWVSILRGF